MDAALIDGFCPGKTGPVIMSETERGSNAGGLQDGLRFPSVSLENSPKRVLSSQKKIRHQPSTILAIL